jgi:acylphosphatase
MPSALKCVVTGRVQGVYYRAATAERARALDLDGWVRNRPDGRVELVVKGEADRIETLLAWLWQGPPAAEVSELALEEWEGDVEPGFVVTR